MKLNFTRKYQIIIFLLVLTGIVIYFFYPKFQFIGMKKFMYDKDNIILFYPKNWKQMEKEELNKKNSKATIGFKKTDSQNSFFTIIVEDVAGKNNFFIQDSIEVLDKNLPKISQNFQRKSADEIKISEIPALKYIFDFQSTENINPFGGKPNNIENCTQYKVIFLKNEKMYYIDFLSGKDDFNNNVKDFEKILKTFQVK